MIQWITPATIAIPEELSRADALNGRRLRQNRYRSRTDVTPEHINSAYMWQKLPIIIDDPEHEGCQKLSTEHRNQSGLYRTAAVPRGVSEENALSTCLNVIAEVQGSYGYAFKYLMFNTGTAAAATERFKRWLDEQPAYEAMDVATLVTSSPTHKIYMYKNAIGNETTYIALNNLDTPSVVFKIATAIMLDMNMFGEATQKFAEAWLTGNGDAIYAAVNEYFAEYRANEELNRRIRAIDELYKAMTANRAKEFKDRMDSINYEMQNLFERIAEYSRDLDRVKGEYLLYTLEDEDSKGTDLKNFIQGCGDKISYINYTDHKLYLSYVSKLIYFEPNLLRRYFDSTRDNCVTTAPAYIQQLLKDIFFENKYELLLETAFLLDIHNNQIYWKESSSLRNCYDNMLKGIPNPHHKYYNCWGDNQSNIVRALVDKDYITAITTAFAATSGLNIADTAVMEKFVGDELPYRYSETPCLKDTATGEVITINTYRRRFEDNASNETN